MFLRSLVLALIAATTPMLAADTDTAASATNELGLDLHRKLAHGQDNLCLSPYSIQSALAMTYAGADGDTRKEMAKVLHYPGDDAKLHASFAAVRISLETVQTASEEFSARQKKLQGTAEPIILQVADRLFGQRGYDFRPPFLALVKDKYAAPLETLDFAKDAAGATRHINRWVEDQTHQRIRDLIPAGALNATSRIVLVNALYLKAPWATPFEKEATLPEPFHIRGGGAQNVPTMQTQLHLGYAEFHGFKAVSIPYVGGDLQFLILVPNDVNGLAAVEAKVTAATLAKCAHLDAPQVILHLPKFKLEPPTIPLAAQLQSLGMTTAFDQPPHSANFDRMAPRRPDDYLYISQVFHKTFIAVDEKGTEAAAATAVAVMAGAAVGPHPAPVEVKVDRPFLFAVQHTGSGACLFLGRITDPR